MLSMCRGTEDLLTFVQGPFVQLRANGLLFKDEKQRDWFHPDNLSDPSSTCSAKSGSSSAFSHATPEALVADNVPICLRNDQPKDCLRDNGFQVDTFMRSTWNPGKFTTSAWKLQGSLSPSTSTILHHHRRQTAITIIPIAEFNAMKRESFESRKRNQAHGGHKTYARIAHATRNS